MGGDSQGCGCFGGKVKPSRREEALQRMKSKRIKAAEPQTLLTPTPKPPTPVYSALDPPQPAPKATKPEDASPQPTRAVKRSLSDKVLANLIRMPDPENVDRNRVTFDPEKEAEVLAPPPLSPLPPSP